LEAPVAANEQTDSLLGNAAMPLLGRAAFIFERLLRKRLYRRDATIERFRTSCVTDEIQKDPFVSEP